jgi:tetratricopeptide (TPR) repeat protein
MRVQQQDSAGEHLLVELGEGRSRQAAHGQGRREACGREVLGPAKIGDFMAADGSMAARTVSGELQRIGQAVDQEKIVSLLGKKNTVTATARPEVDDGTGIDRRKSIELRCNEGIGGPQRRGRGAREKILGGGNRVDGGRVPTTLDEMGRGPVRTLGIFGEDGEATARWRQQMARKRSAVEFPACRRNLSRAGEMIDPCLLGWANVEQSAAVLARGILPAAVIQPEKTAEGERVARLHLCMLLSPGAMPPVKRPPVMRNYIYVCAALLFACAGGEESGPRPEATEDSHVQMAMVLLRDGQHEAALEELRHAREPAGGEQAPSWLPAVGQALLRLRRMAEADSLLRLHEAEWRRTPTLGLVAASMAEQEGDIPLALELYETIPEDAPEFERAQIKLATIAALEMRNSDAERIARRLCESDRFANQARTILAQALLAQGRADEAYVEIMQTPPSPARSILEGEALLRADRPDEAIPILENLVLAEPNAEEPLYLLAQAQLAAGDLEKAGILFGRLSSARYPYEESQLHWSTVLRRQGNHAKADSLLQEYREYSHWRDAMALRTEGLTHSKSGRLDEALAYFERARAMLPGNAELGNDIGAILARLGRYAEAEKAFLETVILNPENAAAHRNLANLYNLQGDEAKRDEHMQAYLRLVTKPSDG